MAQIVLVSRKLQTGITSTFNFFILCSGGEAIPYVTSRGFGNLASICFSESPKSFAEWRLQTFYGNLLPWFTPSLW